MKHPTFDESCGICKTNAGVAPIAGGVIFENELWLVRHMSPGRVPGWVMVQAQRHVPGIGHFDDRETANFGPAFRHFSKVIEEVSGALRVYVAAMGESFPHFHCHLVPRYQNMPKDASAWSVFGLLNDQDVPVDAAEVSRLTEAYREALKANPPPA